MALSKTSQIGPKTSAHGLIKTILIKNVSSWPYQKHPYHVSLWPYQKHHSHQLDLTVKIVLGFCRCSFCRISKISSSCCSTKPGSWFSSHGIVADYFQHLIRTNNCRVCRNLLLFLTTIGALGAASRWLGTLQSRTWQSLWAQSRSLAYVPSSRCSHHVGRIISAGEQMSWCILSHSFWGLALKMASESILQTRKTVG